MDAAAAAQRDAEAAAQRDQEVARGKRALQPTLKHGDWGPTAWGRLERYRDKVGKEWQYDPKSYEWKYV